MQIFTPAGATDDKIAWTTVQLLCGGVSGACKADVWVTDARDCGSFRLNANQKNNKITTASMDLATGAITPTTATTDGYTMSSSKPYYILFTGHALAK